MQIGPCTGSACTNTCFVTPDQKYQACPLTQCSTGSIFGGYPPPTAPFGNLNFYTYPSLIGAPDPTEITSYQSQQPGACYLSQGLFAKNSYTIFNYTGASFTLAKWPDGNLNCSGLPATAVSYNCGPAPGGIFNGLIKVTCPPLTTSTTSTGTTSTSTGTTAPVIPTSGWMVKRIYDTCGGILVGIAAVQYQSSACSVSACSITGSVSSSISYDSSQPGVQSNMFSVLLLSSTNCAGSITQILAAVTNRCVNFGGGVGSLITSASTRVNCSGSSIIVENFSTEDCSGAANQLSTTVGCQSGQSFYSCPASSVCFHKDTVITYKENLFRLSDLQNHADCHIPHTRVSSAGVKIETSDGQILRLTSDHLVFTRLGLKAASFIELGDTLFRNLDDTSETVVTRISLEANEVYFGLNCRESVVLANGIKTSTFGQFHTIPATWMKIVSFFLGPKHASEIGDSVVNWLVRTKIY